MHDKSKWKASLQQREGNYKLVKSNCHVWDSGGMFPHIVKEKSRIFFWNWSLGPDSTSYKQHRAIAVFTTSCEYHRYVCGEV